MNWTENSRACFPEHIVHSISIAPIGWVFLCPYLNKVLGRSHDVSSYTWGIRSKAGIQVQLHQESKSSQKQVCIVTLETVQGSRVLLKGFRSILTNQELLGSHERDKGWFYSPLMYATKLQWYTVKACREFLPSMPSMPECKVENLCSMVWTASV